MLGDLAPHEVRVRFPPSPTGNLHVGNVRALFNWVFARHYGGTFVLRVEDTDAGRNLEESYQGLYDSLTWLGLMGRGTAGRRPVRSLHPDRARRYLSRRGHQAACGQAAYRCFCTREEIEARGRRPVGAASGYDGFCRNLSEQRIAEFEAMSTPSVVRMRVPDADIAFDDLVRGPVRFAAAHVPDYVIVRSNGEPLYTLVNPGRFADEDHSRAPRRGSAAIDPTANRAVRRARQIGVGSGRTPAFGHLPTVLGEGNRRLSKRDQGSGLAEYQQKGYLPEGLLNYLALLGWGIAEDRDVFSIAEMVEAFDIRRVNASPARFDAKKCEAINAATSGCSPQPS